MTPIWHERVIPCGDGHLDRDLDVDVCVIGAGITGITLASELVDAGRTVAVLEMRAVAQGATGYTSGHLTAVPDVRIATLVARFGEEGAREALAGQMSAIDLIARNVARDRIDCGFERVPGYRFIEHDESDGEIEEDVEYARRLGLPDAAIVTEGPTPFVKRAAMFPGQAVFHPVAYVQALAQRVRGKGCRVYEGTRVVRVEESRDDCVVTCSKGRTVRAQAVVHATHTPLGRAFPMQARVAPYQSYCFGVHLNTRAPHALMWDTEDPYHYVRTLRGPERDLLIVGGEDHKTGQERDPEGHYAKLEQWTRERFDVRDIVARWSWPVFEPVDGLPYIGRLGQHRAIYVATGFAGNGLTFGTLAATMLTRMLLGDALENSVFRPQRYKPVAGAQRFVGEAANVAAHLVGDRVARPACATCPHMGGVVQWNEAEHTWDCPLHGSRFLASGKVLCGPATEDLSDVAPETPALVGALPM